MRIILITVFLSLLPALVYAQDQIVNVYAWTGEIPDEIIRQFEKETNIKVNFSTYENNEIMYAKLRTSKKAGYDVVMPSSYFVDRMRRQNLLLKLDKNQLPNWKNLNPDFLHPIYDPETNYSVPFLWGVTGIFYNKDYFPIGSIKTWDDLWSAKFQNQLMLLDDTREVFSMALISLGYPANDRDPTHIKQAYLKLQKLMPNVKVFSTETVVSIMIDEDATVGMAWNGDSYKASSENNNIEFIFPQQGFVIWVDNFAIPINAPHKDTAYKFINFMLRPDIAKTVAMATGFPITNLEGKKLLPEKMRENPIMYPSKDVLSRGQFQTDVGDDTLSLYEKYWELLKIGS